MSGELADGMIARVEQDGRVLSGGSDPDRLSRAMDRHAPEPDKTTEGPPVGSPGGDGASPSAPALEEKPTRGRQRFADLTREREEARAEAAAAKADREALARERDELKARLSTPAPAPEPQQATVQAPPPAAFPDEATWLAKPENANKSWYDYTDERAAHNYTVLRDRERREEAERSSRQSREETERAYRAEEQTLKSELPDYDAKIAALGPHDVSAVVERAVKQLGPRVAYHLASNPEILRELTAETLVDIDNPAFAAAVATTKRYLATLMAPKPAPATRPAQPPPPAPYTPVNGNSATVAPASSELAKKGNFDAYRIARARERGVKPRY